MPPKAKGKKGRKAEDDDAYWESKAAALDIKSPPPVDEEEDVPIQSGKKAGNPFDMLEDGDDDDGGGLLGTIQASKKRDKKSKKKRTDLDGGDLDTDPTPASAPAHVDTNVNPDDEWPEEEVKPKKSKKGKKADDEPMELDEAPAASPALELAPVPVQTAVNVDDEWPEDDVKLKKGKKGKKGKKTVDGDEDDWMNGTKEEKKVDVVAAAVDETPAPAPVQEVETAAVEAEVDGEPEDDGPKILTKAQKEKLKKEKEKAKKKAQAAGKTQPAATPEPAAEATPVPVPEAEDESEEEGGAGDDKKKKRKKKPAAKPVEPVSVAKGAKKVSAQILALQAAMEEKKRIEEQARRAEEERLRALAEEEERIAAEEKRIEDQKLAKRAKEKEKRAQAKAEGRLLTPAQKKEKAAAEARKQAMLASGMKVAGLHAEGPERKKPGFAKKKPVQAVKEAEPTLEEATISPATPAVEEEAPASSPEPVANGGDDDWDKSEDEAAAVEGIVAGMDEMRVEGDDWDKSDDESATPPTAPSASTGAAAQTTAIPPVSATPKSTSIPNGKPAVPKTKGSAAPAEADASSEEETSSEEDSDDTDESSEDEMEARKRRAIAKIQERQKAAEAAKSKEDLRSPICCILGHVDTGKTKLLDKIRQTSVQEGEAGGITQQIGATFFPKGAIEEKTAVVNKTGEYQVEIPGLLIIDTPGHESFTNLRTRGSSLCNIAILVVDITHGLEPQTIESLNLLRNGKTPFIVALNKIDRMYGWKPTPNGGFRETLAQQAKTVRSEFEDRVKKTKLAFAEQGLNAEIFDENTNLARTVSLVPTSAITGEGIPDMLMLLVKLTQERMNQSLMYISELECTILEVKVIEGLGTTIDVILSNGVMRESDKIVLCGMDGPIVTTVRALLTPQPLRELRVKSAYVHHKEVKAALGIKISAPGLEKAIAGARLYVAQDDDEVEAYKDLAMQDVNDLQRFASKGPGVWVQASTLGSLEALLTFLQQMKIPVRNFAIGPVFRSHVLRAGRMLEVASEYALILAFDVPIDKDAKEYADKEGVKIFSAMIIYHLFDAFKKYMGEVQEAKRQAAMPNAVWPVRLSIIKAFANRDPIVLGVDIVEGTLRTGMPVGVVRNDKETGKRDIIVLGKITSIEINHKSMEIVKKSQIGAGAAVKIERAPYQAAKLYGRHFDDKDEVVSLITRQSIDTLKNSFRDQVDLADWGIIKKMKVEQGIP